MAAYYDFAGQRIIKPGAYTKRYFPAEQGLGNLAGRVLILGEASKGGIPFDAFEDVFKIELLIAYVAINILRLEKHFDQFFLCKFFGVEGKICLFSHRYCHFVHICDELTEIFCKVFHGRRVVLPHSRYNIWIFFRRHKIDYIPKRQGFTSRACRTSPTRLYSLRPPAARGGQPKLTEPR